MQTSQSCYIPAKEIQNSIAHISRDSLHRYVEQKLISCIRTPNKSGQRKRFYHKQDIFNLFGLQQQEEASKKRKFIYARESSTKQEADFKRQIDQFSIEYPEHEVISNIASGINFRRQGIQKILELAYKGMVAEVAIAHKD
jgi:putative resolvase